ncbi:MAG: relaxase, partial [Oxalobacteraceae bacterium]
MKAKVTRGGGFRGALNYAFDKVKAAAGDKEAERVGGNMDGADPQELSAEFAVVRQLRPDIEKPVWHCSLSLPAGERLDSERWAAVAEDFMKHMEFDPASTPYVAVRHNDTKHDHIHIIASRIGLDGQVWHGKWEARRAIEATQALERTHGLTLTPGLGEAKAERKASTADEIGMADHRGELTPRERLQRAIDTAIKDKPSAAELAERLEAAGVTVRANIASTGRMNGFSFEVDGLAYKGADLGAAYKWKGLQDRGVTYDASRDGEALSKFKTANTASSVEQRREGRDARDLRK